MPTPDHLQNTYTPEVIITRDDDKIADILARQSYKSEDNPHVGYSQTISDGGVRGKEHLIRNIFYDDKPVGFATATISTGEGNLFALLADNAYQESFLLDVPVSSYDRAADAWEGIADKELDGYYDHGCMLFSDEEQMIDFYEAHRALIDYRHERFEQIHSLARTNRSAAERLSLALPVNEVTDIKAILTKLSDNAPKEVTGANRQDDDFISLSPDTRFQFIGEIGAAQLDNAARSLDILLALATAKEMTEAGKDALSVKMATGWEQGADAKWRYELPDMQMPEYSLSLLRDGHADGRPVTLGDLLPQAPFLNAYPDMASMPVITDRERPKGAAYNPETRQITISANELHIFNTEDLNAMSVSETLLHEIQHAIQHAEGFATGGNIQTVANQQRLEAEKEMEALHDIYKAYENIDFRTLSADTHEALMAYEERDRYERQHEQELKAYILARQKMEMAELDLVAGRLSEKNYQNYRSLAGEVEARNTVARAGMTPEERRRTLAAATEDVARESQRVIFSGASCLIREPQAALLHNDIMLRDKLVSLMQDAGISVNTDWREGQAVLDAAHSDIKLQNTTQKTRNITKVRRANFDDSDFNTSDKQETAIDPQFETQKTRNITKVHRANFDESDFNNQKTDSNLTENQQEQVRSDAFKNWFGDWQDTPDTASKLIDKNGEPMVLYHGTNVDFNTFEPHEGLRWHSWGEQYTVNAKGFFFSDNYDDAYKHANSNAFMKGGDKIVMPVYVSMKNPADLSKTNDADTEQLFHDLTGYWPQEHPDYHRQDQWWRIVEDEEFDVPARLADLGYDGIIFAEQVDDTTNQTIEKSYYVTNPNQVKSATLNNGEFSLGNSDIRFHLADQPSSPMSTKQPIFISNALLALGRISQQKATPQQWLGMLKNSNGIKPGEDRWTGLSEWLLGNAEKSLTKQQVLDFIAQNQIQIQETVYAQPEDSPRFAELKKEFIEEKNRVDERYEEADREYGEFLDRMSEKYGPEFDIEHDLNKEEWEEEDRLLTIRNSFDTMETDNTPEGIAFELMSQKYGPDFYRGFDYNEEGLEVSDSYYAATFLGLRPIHDTRLEYTTPNLNNKKEIALTVPDIAGWNEDDELHFGDAGHGKAIAWIRFGDTVMPRNSNEEEVRSRIVRMPKPEDWEKVDGSHFVNKHDVYFFPQTRNMAGHSYIFDDDNGHFSIEGPMARRMTDTRFDSLQEAVNAFNRQWVLSRPSYTTERVLVIDEIQSKRHQTGHKKGYISTPAAKAWDDYRDLLSRQYPEGWSVDNPEARRDGLHILTDEEQTALEGYLTERNREAGEMQKSKLVPDAPFERNWHELAMKRMLRYAAEHGYDRVAWTTGEQQVERYDIGEVLNQIVVGENRSADELNHYFGQSDIKQDGKVVTLVLKDPSKSISLAVDDEGKIFYCHETNELDNKKLEQLVDKRLADEILKADCQTISTEDFQIGTEGITSFYDHMLPQFINRYTKKWNVHAEDVQVPNLEGWGERTILHSVAVSPQMKADVMQGQPMFFLTPQGDAYGFTHGDTIYIDPRIATSETPIHEYAHLWAQAMRQHNPEEWRNIIGLMKQVTPVWEMVREQYAHLSSDSDIAEEVLAQYSGKQGMKQLQRVLNSHATGLSDKQARDILDRIKAAIDRFWQKTADFLHIHYHSVDEVASRVMHDLLHQVNPQRLPLQMAAQSPETSNNVPYAAVTQQPGPHAHPPKQQQGKTIPSPTATDKKAEQADRSVQQQQPKGEGILSPSADNSLSTGEGRGETSSPLANNKPTRHNAQPDGTILAYSTAPYDEVRTLAHGIKEGDTAAIKEAARRMAGIINAMPDKEKVILIPMPSHEGHATYTKALADETARLTGSRTADCLLATPHPSLYDLKKSRGIEKLPSPQFRLDESAATKQTLQDRIPVIIDNVLDTGTTAVAAAKAFGEKTDVRITVLGNTSNFYLFDNHIELAAGGKRNDPLANANEKTDEHTHDKTGKVERESLSSLPPSADNTATPFIAPSQRPGGFQFQLIGTKGAAEMDRSDGQDRLDDLMMAMVMEKQDKKPLEIKIATGWERGADGKWRHEIPDIEINPYHFAAQWVETYNKYWNAVRSSSAENFRTATQPYTQQLDRLYENFKKEHRLRDILSPDSPVLKAYPQIGDFRLKIYNSGKGGGGHYDTRTDTVHLNLYGRPDAKSIAGTLAHEIQHAIQYMEGFAYGAPLRKASEVAELQRQFHRLEDDIDDIGKEKAKLFHQLYSLPGWSQRTHIAYYKVTDEKHKGFGDDILRADPKLSRQLIENLKTSQPLVYQLGVELIKQIETKEERMLKMMDEMVEIDKKMSSPDRNHTVSAGEVEARNVRTRMDMTPEKRKSTLAESTEDVARMFQKVSYDYLLSANEQQDTNRNNPKNHTTMPTHDQHRDYLQDFLDGKSRLQAAKAEMNLNKVVRFEMPDRTNRVMTNAEFIQYALDNNLTVAATPEKGNFPEAKAAEIERAFSGFNENIVRRNLGSYYKATPEMKAYEQLLQKMFLARNEEKPSNEEYFKARKAAIDAIIDANTPKKMYYHVQYDSNGASMAISKTMYDYAAFIQKASIESLTRQLTDLLSEPQFNEWLQKHEDGVVLISEADILRLKDGQLQLGWYHMPEGSQQPEFIADDLAKRDFHQQVNILLEGIENATALHRDMQVESLLQQLDADRISLEEPMTVRLTKGETVTVSAVAQDKPGHDTYLVSDEGKPYIPYYVNSDDFNKVADKAIEDGAQQLLVRQNSERMEPALAEMRQQLLTLMQDEKLMHFIAPFPEVRLSVGKDGEIYLKDGELRINDFDHNGRQYDIPLAEERPHVQLTDLQEALQTAHLFQARMKLLENMEAADVNQATLQPERDLIVRLRGWEETGDTHQVASLQIEDNHFREGNTFPSYDIIETDETYLLNKVNDLLKEEMGINQSQMQMAHEALREVMRDYGIGKMELPDGESIELKGGQLTLHAHDANGTSADLSYNDLPHSRQSDIFNHVADNIQKMEERLAGEELKLAAMMVDMQTDKLYVDDAVATLYHVPDPKERQDIIVNAIRMDEEGALKAISDEDKEYPIENLHLPERITVIDNAVRMITELREKESEQALNPDESQRMTYPQYLQQLMQASKVQTLALYDGKVIDNKEGELIYSDLTRTIPFNDLPKEERNSLAWSGTELLVSHLESELEKFVRHTDTKEVSLPNGDTVTLDDSRSYDKLRFVLHDPDGNTHAYKAMEKHEKVEVLTAFADIAAQEARDLFMAHVAGRGDGRLHIAPDNWIEQLPDSHLAIVRTDESGESKTLSFENVNGFTQLNVVSFAAEQQENLDRQQATEKAADQTIQSAQSALSQRPEGEETPSPSADNTLSTGEGRGEASSPLATDQKADQSAQATQAPTDGLSPFQAYLTIHDAQALTRLMQEHQTDSIMLPWGDQVRLDENGSLMLHGHNEDATPKVFPFSELSETQQEVFARHAAESLIKNAEQQSQAVSSPSARNSLSTGDGQGDTPSPTATELSQEADRLRERVAALMAENEVINVSFEPTTVHPFATWQDDIYAGETQAMDGIHRDESGWLQMTDGNVLLNSVSEYLPQEQIAVLQKAEAAILQHLGQQQDSGNALQLDQAKMENFLGAEMPTRDRDAFLDKIRHNDSLMAVVEEKMDRRVQPNALVTFAESELQAQEHRAVTMMKMLDEHAIPSWGSSYIEVKESHLVWQKNDGSKAEDVLDMPGAIARTTLQMAIDDLTPQMEEKVKDLMAMQKDNVIPVNDLPVKVHTRDNDNNFHDAIVIPEKIGFLTDDQVYVQDTEGVRHSLSSLHDESKILLLNDIIRSSQNRSEEMDAAVDNPLASTQQATEPPYSQPAEKALVEQEQQRLMQIMRTANVSEVDLWDSDYSIEMADGRLTLAEYADGTTKRTSIPDLDTDAAMDTMGMAASQITSNLKAALMDYMHDADIKTYETDFNDSKASIDISHDDIQVQLGNDNAFMHINELDDLTTTELLTKAISEVDDKYLKAWVGSQQEASLEDVVEVKGQADLLPEVRKLEDLERKAQEALPFSNPQWQRDNDEQIEGARLMLYGNDSGIRAEYLDIAPYEGRNVELGYAVGNDIDAQNIDSLTENYFKQYPDQQMVNNGGDDLTVKFLDVRHALQFQAFVQQMVSAEPKLTDAETQIMADIKERYPDTVVIHRKGDGYEAYGKDAQRLSFLLELPIHYDRGFAVTKLDARDIDSTLAEVTDKGQHVTVTDGKELSIHAPGQHFQQAKDGPSQAIHSPLAANQKTAYNVPYAAVPQQPDTHGQTNPSQQPKGEKIPSPYAATYSDLHAIANPLADIKAQLRDSGIIVMPVWFGTEDRHYMDTGGWVKTPFLDFSPEGSHRPETVIAPVSVEYQKASDTLLLHGKNANGDYLTLPLESPTKGNERAYTVIREQLEQPLQKAIENANMVEYFADSSLENGRVSDTFIRSITDTILHAQNGNFIHVGDYDKASGQLHVTEKNESGHTVNETWTDPMGIARMIARKEAVAVSRWNLAEASLSYPTLDEVTQSRTAQKQSEQSKANEKYLYTLFENRDPHWDEKVVIISTDVNVTPWGKEVRLTGESNMGQMVFNPDDTESLYAQTGNKIDGIITDISRLGFTDREKNMPYNLMDPISYCRDDGRTMGPDQIRYDGLMVDFGPNHFYFQQILSGPEEGRYRASYEIENLNHGTREKVVDADIDMVYERMRRFLSDYDLRESQPHSLHETEGLVRDITNHALDQMVTLGSRIYNIPTGDEEMADDPRYPVMDVSMIEVDRKGEIILHGNGGPAPLDSLDETARFEVLRRALNDMMDQNLDLQVKREHLMQHANANGHLTDIIMPFENPRTLYDKDGGRQSVGALMVDDLNNITLFHNVADAYDFLVRKDAGKDSRTDRTDFNDLSPASQRKVLDGALDFYSSRDLQQQALREAEDHAERMTTRQYSSFTNNMSNPNSEEKIMRPEEQQPQVEQPKADQQQQAAASQSQAREQATEQIRAAIGPDQKVRLDENERVALETNKGATINVQTVSITKNETVSLYGEIEGSKKSVSASQLTDDSLSKLAIHLDDLRSARQSMAAEKPAEQKAQPAQEQQPAQTQQAKGEAIPAPAAELKEQKAQEQPKGEAIPAAEQKAEQPRERKVEPIEIKPDSKVEFNITKNPVLDRVYDIQLFVDGEKKAGHHLSIEDRKDFFDKKVTGPELVPKYFEKELAGQKLPEVIERHHTERKQEAQEQKPAQEQKAPEQKVEQPKERKADTVEIKPDSKVQVNVVPNKALDHVYDIQLYVDGQKQGRGHHLSIEDRKAFFDQKTPEEKTAFAASLLPKYFEKELAGQKLPDNIDRYRPEKKQEAQEQKPAQAAEQKPAQTAEQKTEQKAGASPVDVWKDARGTGEQERMTFVQRDGQYGKFYQTYGADAAKVAQLTDKPTKEIKDGPNAQLAYINVKQADMPDLMKTMKEQEIPYKVVGMDGKYARVLPEAQAKTQAADLSGYKVPEGKQVTDVKVWQFQGKPFMNGVVDGVKLDAKEISKEDWTAFKGQKATPEQLVGKYYAPAEMENKQAQKQAKAMAR